MNSPYVYFIERIDNQLWVSENPTEDHTANPHRALLFQTIQKADDYIDNNNLREWYHATEHEFMDTIDL